MTSRFIVSTGRCGSTLLSSLLGKHPDVLALSELFASLQPGAFPAGKVSGEAFWEMLNEPQPIWSAVLEHRLEPREFRYPVDNVGSRFDRQTGVPPIATVCLPTITDDPDRLYSELESAVPSFPQAEIGELYRQLFDWLTARHGKRVWIERSGGSILYVKELAHHFQDARFVHLYRDGCETAFSMSEHVFFRLHLIAGMLATRPGDEVYGRVCEIERDAARKGGRPLLPELFDPVVVRELHIPLGRFGRRWSAMILHGARQLTQQPQQSVLYLSLESMVANPSEQLRRLVAFFDLTEPSEDWLTWATAQIEDRPLAWPELPAEERARLQRTCAVGERLLQELEVGNTTTLRRLRHA